MSRAVTMSMAVSTLAAALCLSGCGGETVSPPTDGPLPGPALVEYTTCKSFDDPASRWAVGSDLDCIEYAYDGESVLTLVHVNACFNCCPDSFTASIHDAGQGITIHEIEWLSDGCHCLCLYDLTYEIPYVAPGIVTVRVNEPYVQAGETVLEVTLDLESAPTGRYCVTRDRYPWGL